LSDYEKDPKQDSSDKFVGPTLRDLEQKNITNVDFFKVKREMTPDFIEKLWRSWPFPWCHQQEPLSLSASRSIERVVVD
jgi:hypothetical protein